MAVARGALTPISSVEKEQQSKLGNLADHGNLFQLVKAVEVC